MENGVVISLISGGMALLGVIVAGVFSIFTNHNAKRLEQYRNTAQKALEELTLRISVADDLCNQLVNKTGESRQVVMRRAIDQARTTTDSQIRIGGLKKAKSLLEDLRRK